MGDTNRIEWNLWFTLASGELVLIGCVPAPSPEEARKALEGVARLLWQPKEGEMGLWIHGDR